MKNDLQKRCSQSQDPEVSSSDQSNTPATVGESSSNRPPRPEPGTVRVKFCKMRMDGQAIFWNVEAYSSEGNMFPVATAYVVEFCGTASLSFILVADQWRRLGYGTALIDAIRERWPMFQSTAPMDEGASLKFAIATKSPALISDDEE